MKYQVIVWGVDDYNTLGLLRQINVDYVDCHFLVHGRRKYCATISNCCKSFSVAKTIELGLNFLKTKTSSKREDKIVLITNSDIIAEIIDDNKDWLNESYYLMGIKKSKLLSSVMDKNVMCKIAQQCGIEVPLSKEINYNTIIDEEITYPCILKPAKKLPNVPSNFKTKICANETELKETLQNLNKNGVYIIQKYIDKEKDVLIYGCRFNNGEIVLAGSFVKDRWYNNADGSHGIIMKEIYQCVDTNAIRLFLQRIDYYGLFSFEYGIENSKSYFYEVNLRNDGTSHYFWQAGANLPLAWILDCYGSGKEKTLYVNTSAFFIDEIDDYDNVRKGVITKDIWKSDYKRASIYKYYSLSDKKPYLVRKLYGIYRLILNFLIKKV